MVPSLKCGGARCRARSHRGPEAQMDRVEEPWLKPRSIPQTVQFCANHARAHSWAERKYVAADAAVRGNRGPEQASARGYGETARGRPLESGATGCRVPTGLGARVFSWKPR